MKKRLAFDYIDCMEILESCCNHYLKSAPVVSRWADNLYMVLQDDTTLVTVKELITINMLLTDDNQWIHPAYATNIVYKCMNSMNQNTTGIIDH